MLWRYRGKDYSVPVSVQFPYTSYENVASLTQTAGAAGLTEASTNLLRTGASNQVVRADGNNVINVFDIELTDNILVAGHVSVELRSPVQQNDQYVVFERNGFDFGEDVDGDGRNETADVAVYRRVIAQEDLNVRGVLFAAAVRVDTTTRLRLVPSRGTAPAVGDFVQSDWYATDVGIVKRSAQVVGSTHPIEFEEELVSWDGITAGIGVMDAVLLRRSTPSDPAFPITDVAAAVALDSNVVLFSTLNPVVFPFGVRITAIDLRGRVLSSVEYLNVPVGFGPVTTARLGNEAFLVSSSAGQLQLLRFNDLGVLLNATPLPLGPPTLVDVQLNSFDAAAAAAIGDEIWIAWLRVHRLPGDVFVEDLVVRPFDRFGTPLAAETILRSSPPIPPQFTQPKMTANGSTALLSFLDTHPNERSYGHVTLSRTGSQPITGVAGKVINETMLVAAPVTSGSVAGLLWRGFSASGGGVTLKGLRIDNNGQAIRAGVGDDFNTENLPGTMFDTDGFPVFGSGVASLPLLAFRNDRLYEEDELTQPIIEIGEFVPGTGPWASTGRFGRAVRARQMDVTGHTFTFGFADRLLIVSSDAANSRVVVVWRQGLE